MILFSQILNVIYDPDGKQLFTAGNTFDDAITPPVNDHRVRLRVLTSKVRERVAALCNRNPNHQASSGENNFQTPPRVDHSNTLTQPSSKLMLQGPPLKVVFLFRFPSIYSYVLLCCYMYSLILLLQVYFLHLCPRSAIRRTINVEGDIRNSNS